MFSVLLWLRVIVCSSLRYTIIGTLRVCYCSRAPTGSIVTTSAGIVHFTDSRFPVLTRISSPYYVAWSKQWRHSSVPDLLTDAALDNVDDTEALGFSPLHQVYLQESLNSFINALSGTARSSLDSTDSFGRTVLSWAAEKRDHDIIARLLTCGADPNKASNRGCAPLYYSICGQDVIGMKLLLKAKADMNASGVKKCPPLHYAASYDKNGELVQCLLDEGAQINQVDKLGRTALRHAVQDDNVDTIPVLLSAGAKYTVEDINEAIKYDCPEALQVLLVNWVSIERVCFDDRNILVRAAEFADCRTLRILSEEWPFESSLSKLRLGRRIALDKAIWRRDNNDEWSSLTFCPPDDDPTAWFDAFVDMVEAIKVRQRDWTNDEDEDNDHGSKDAEIEDLETGKSGDVSREAGHDSSSDDGEYSQETWENTVEYPV